MYKVEVGGVERIISTTKELQKWLDNRLLLPESQVWVVADNKFVDAQQISGVKIKVASKPPFAFPERDWSQERPIQDYLVLSIFSLMFCCLPFGIVAVVYAAQTRGYLMNGDLGSAQNSSESARTWCYWSIGIGLLTIGFYVILKIVG